ncbi:uncharacterized protein VICG_01936 [Vittaforma corneae ATCC 50505]|uniref:J domain-containing protein n=1 Tax=Vittaforma corneae (strain ATCC 50505) TaxID=993615 RepID=L2GKA4_VITCO|nr:uncharacterized protein VICG_01936 [Vittaforma corneae ATCC 50505]ELA41054.1 hypothetical protein VICG_01936 [Vittaforma corneae ATCC 50505]
MERLELYRILNVRKDAPKDAVKQKYRKMLFDLHPNNKKTGNESAFIELQEAYKRYLTGDLFSNCWAVVENNRKEFECRCGGIYKIEEGRAGRIECEYCSCFIEVEDPILRLHKSK